MSFTFDPKMLDFIQSKAVDLDVLALVLETLQNRYDPFVPAEAVRAAATALQEYVRSERGLAPQYVAAATQEAEDST